MMQACAWSCSRWRLPWRRIRLWQQRPQGRGQRRSKEVRTHVSVCRWQSNGYCGTYTRRETKRDEHQTRCAVLVHNDLCAFVLCDGALKTTQTLPNPKPP